MLPLLLLTTLILPLTQGETCLTTNQLLEMIQEREAVVKDKMKAKIVEEVIEEMDAKFENEKNVMRAEFEKEKKLMKAEVQEVIGEVTRKRDLPNEMFCAYQDQWTVPDTTMSFDSFILNYNNADKPGGGDGEMDLNTGVFTCLTGGHYTISFSAYHNLNPGEKTNLYIYLNGKEVAASDGEQLNSSGNGGHIITQGGRTLVSQCSILRLTSHPRFSTWTSATPSPSMWTPAVVTSPT